MTDTAATTLRAALEDIAAEARSARYALCAHEVTMRLENIARRAEAALAAVPPPAADP